MKVFLDTNVFYNNWFASNPSFKLLFRYLNNESEELYLSELVVQEVENIRNRELIESLNEAKRHLKDVQKRSSSNIGFSESQLNISEYSLFNCLEGRVEHIDRIDYDDVPHKELVYRALHSIKPFSGQEKGYRDALIWLSFLQYLEKENVDGDIAFITANKSDFFTYEKKKLVLHPKLQEDIVNIGVSANIIPFTNIFDFVNQEVDKDEHLVDRSKLCAEYDDFLMEETLEHLKALDNDALSELLSTSLFRDKLTPVLDIQADNWDLVDDTEIYQVSKISDSEAYVSCQFIATGIDLMLTIDLNEYTQYKSDIELIRSFSEASLNHVDQTAVISFGFKAYVQASLLFDTVNECPKELHVEGMSI
ncbi:PIN domain-containing protein [Vibrio splendidus]|uniref:PIN domain-containing protein n=1 Tax=Vibrio splendidus TaxID=29497 RepID=UPI002468A9C1|nr:PIN domain-containing protein [Vibrio splendidus]MDH5934224.1 PIN domain-containing protein [Vibrio splendidus]